MVFFLTTITYEWNVEEQRLGSILKEEDRMYEK